MVWGRSKPDGGALRREASSCGVAPCSVEEAAQEILLPYWFEEDEQKNRIHGSGEREKKNCKIITSRCRTLRSPSLCRPDPRAEARPAPQIRAAATQYGAQLLVGDGGSRWGSLIFVCVHQGSPASPPSPCSPSSSCPCRLLPSRSGEESSSYPTRSVWIQLEGDEQWAASCLERTSRGVVFFF